MVKAMAKPDLDMVYRRQITPILDQLRIKINSEIVKLLNGKTKRFTILKAGNFTPDLMHILIPEYQKVGWTISEQMHPHFFMGICVRETLEGWIFS